LGLKYRPSAPIPSPLRMGAIWISKVDESRPLARVKGTESQRTQYMILMAGLVTLLLMNIFYFGKEGAHFEMKPQNLSILELWCKCSCLIAARTIAWHLHMPCEQGKPRKGASWYASTACRKRQQNFERAFSMAQTQLVHKNRRLGMPPMANIEEIIPDEPIQVPPAHLLFTVPENRNPPTCFLEKIT